MTVYNTDDGKYVAQFVHEKFKSDVRITYVFYCIHTINYIS